MVAKIFAFMVLPSKQRDYSSGNFATLLQKLPQIPVRHLKEVLCILAGSEGLSELAQKFPTA